MLFNGSDGQDDDRVRPRLLAQLICPQLALFVVHLGPPSPTDRRPRERARWKSRAGDTQAAVTSSSMRVPIVVREGLSAAENRRRRTKSSELNVRDQHRSLSLGAEHHRGEHRNGRDCGANHHRHGKSHVPLDSKIGQHRSHQAAKDRPLVVTEIRWRSPAPRSGSARTDNAATACACRRRTNPAR